MSLAALCSELALEHRLSPEETLSIMVRALSDSLTLALKCRVAICLDGNLLHIFREERGGENIREIDYRSLRKDVIRLFRNRFEKELMKRKALDEYEYLSTLQGTVLRGVVDRIMNDGSLLVLFFIEELLSCRELYAVCPLYGQSPHERGLLRKGDAYSFYVSSVRLLRMHGVFRHEIRVSRTSPRLTEILLAKQSGQKGIRCVRRIAGKINMVVSTTKIPREAVKAVGKELGERIVIKWHSPKSPKPKKRKSRRTPTWG